MASAAEVVPSGRGWREFAGILILIGGVFNLIDGLTAVSRSNYFSSLGGGTSLALTDNIKTWGWVAMAIGVIMIFAGVAIFAGALWARVVGIAVAAINAIFQLAYLPHYPFWSLVMIIVDILIIYGLSAHGKVSEAEL